MRLYWGSKAFWLTIFYFYEKRNLCMPGTFFLYIFFSFAKFQCFHRNLGFFTILLSNSLYGISDKAPRIFAPHLDPNCLQRSSTVFTMTKSYTMFSTKFLKASAFFVNKGTLTDSILFFRNTWRWQIFWRHVQEWKQLIDS